VGVTKVEFYDGSTLVGSDTTSPYSLSWNSRNGDNGPRVLTARALDAVGYSTTSAAVTVTADNDFTPPSGAITAPTEGSTLTGTVTITANATDDRGVYKVEFYAGSTLLCNDFNAPFACSYNTRNLSNGSSALTLKITDSSSNIATSAPVSVVVDNDLTAPTTALTSPTAGAVLSGTVLLEATASDDRGTVSKVDFYLGSTLLGSDTTAPFSFSWNTTTRTNGAYTLRSRAYDPAGNNTYSATVSITVSN
jgi:hypothetical protein